MAKRPERPAPQAKRVTRIVQPSVTFATPKSLNVLALAVLSLAFLMLVAFTVYIYQRRRLRAVGSRARRTKTGSAMPQPVFDSDVMYDDTRRGQRAGPRRSLPWPLALFSQRPGLFPDSTRGFPFAMDLQRLWSGAGTPVVEATVDDLADVVPYDGGPPGGAGPRFMATTASGKSLQVVVKTAAVPARHSHQSEQQEAEGSSRSWEPLGSAGSRQLGATGLQGLPSAAAASLSLTPSHSHGSGVLDPINEGTSSYGGFAGQAGRGQPLRGAAASPAAAAAGGSVVAVTAQHSASSAGAGPQPTYYGQETNSDDDDFAQARQAYEGGATFGGRYAAAAVGHVPGEGHGAAPLGGLGAAAQGVGGSGGNAAAAFGISGGFGRGGGVDPAVAWYSRALHRQVSAAAAAAAAAAPAAPKAHQA